MFNDRAVIRQAQINTERRTTSNPQLHTFTVLHSSTQTLALYLTSYPNFFLRLKEDAKKTANILQKQKIKTARYIQTTIKTDTPHTKIQQ